MERIVHIVCEFLLLQFDRMGHPINLDPQQSCQGHRHQCHDQGYGKSLHYRYIRKKGALRYEAAHF